MSDTPTNQSGSAYEPLADEEVEVEQDPAYNDEHLSADDSRRGKNKTGKAPAKKLGGQIRRATGIQKGKQVKAKQRKLKGKALDVPTTTHHPRHVTVQGSMPKSQEQTATTSATGTTPSALNAAPRQYLTDRLPYNPVLPRILPLTPSSDPVLLPATNEVIHLLRDSTGIEYVQVDVSGADWLPRSRGCVHRLLTFQITNEYFGEGGHRIRGRRNSF